MIHSLDRNHLVSLGTLAGYSGLEHSGVVRPMAITRL